MVIRMQGAMQIQLLLVAVVQGIVAGQNLHNLHPPSLHHQHFLLRRPLQHQLQHQHRRPQTTVGEMKVLEDRMDEQAQVVADVAVVGTQLEHQQMKHLQNRHQRLR